MVSVSAKFQLSSGSRSGLKVPGGVVGCSVVGWDVVGRLRPILVFSLSLGQAEEKTRCYYHMKAEKSIIWKLFWKH